MVMATVDAVTPFLRIYLKEMVADMDRGTHGRMLPETSALKPKTKGKEPKFSSVVRDHRTAVVLSDGIFRSHYKSPAQILADLGKCGKSGVSENKGRNVLSPVFFLKTSSLHVKHIETPKCCWWLLPGNTTMIWLLLTGLQRTLILALAMVLLVA